MDKQFQLQLHKAKKGDVDAQVYVGLVLCADIKKEGDFKAGMHFLEDASIKSPVAQYMLGRIYGKELMAYEQSVFWLEKAAKQGNILAMIDLASCYQLGLGVEKDDLKALTLYEKTLPMEHPVALHNMGHLYLEAPSLMDVQKAYDCFLCASEKGYGESYFALGIMYCDGIYVERNLAEAVAWMEKAFYFGKYEVSQKIGHIFHDFENHFGQENFEMALSWFLKGAKKKVPICAYLAATMLYEGQGCDMDYREAFLLYSSAAELGFAPACVEVASMLIRGEGVAKNTKMAERWLERAVDYGDEDAGYLLEQVKTMNSSQGKAAVQRDYSGSFVVASLGGTTFTGLEEERRRAEEERLQQERLQQEQRKGIMMAARARTDGRSFSDDDSGVVYREDGSVAQYVNATSGVIWGTDGSIAMYDEKSKSTYDFKDNSISYNNETFETTYNVTTGKTSYHGAGFTNQYER